MSKLKEGNLIENKYKLIRILGEGGMNSVIWEAERLTIENNNLYDQNFRNRCAIKIISLDSKNSSEQIANINKEINTTTRAKFKSDSFCEFYEWFWIDDQDDPKNKQFAIVMELVDGIVLSNYLKEKGMIPVIEAMEIYENIILGIKSLHNMNSNRTEIILHRDLKLDNVMLTSDFSRIKIIDLGIASVLDNSNERALKIDETSIYGSPGYVPPEVKLLKARMSKKQKAQIITEFWDIFAAGVILYLLLTGEFPYNTKESGGINVYARPEIYDFPTVGSFVPDVSPIIENIIFKSLVSSENEKHMRYKTVDEVLMDVQKWKENPNDRTIKLLKPAEERKLEKIERLLIKEAGYEISSKLWIRSMISFGIVSLAIIVTAILIIFTVGNN